MTKTSITKVLIYHADSSTDSMLIGQLRNSKDHSPMILDYHSSKQGECQVAVLECSYVSFIRTMETKINRLCLVHSFQRILFLLSSTNDLSRRFEYR